MYAIVEIAGQQFRVEKDQKIFVQKLEQKAGSQFDIESVLLLDNDKNILVGEPLINGAKIVARVISHTKGDKVKIFKKNKRKGYQILNGHRQQYSEIMIEEIIEDVTKVTHVAGAKKEKPAVKESSADSYAGEKEAVTGIAVTEPKAKAAARKVTAGSEKDSAAKESKTETKKAATRKPAAKASEAKSAGKPSGKQTVAAQEDEKKKAPVKKAAAKKPDTKKTKK